MTSTINDAAPQRQRWASGIFQLMLSSVSRLVANGIKQWRWKLVEAALSLLFTSRLFLIYLTVAAIAVAGIWPPGKVGLYILSLVFTAMLLPLIYLWMIFRKAAEKTYSMDRLLFMPANIGMVGLSQAATLTGLRGKRWTRTVR